MAPSQLEGKTSIDSINSEINESLIKESFIDNGIFLNKIL